jgi:hypothetical protein
MHPMQPTQPAQPAQPTLARLPRMPAEPTTPEASATAAERQTLDAPGAGVVAPPWAPASHATSSTAHGSRRETTFDTPSPAIETPEQKIGRLGPAQL